VETWDTGEAGRHFEVVFDGAVSGDWQLVGREGRVEAVLAEVSELLDLLGGSYPFRPTASVSEGVTQLWLPEIGLQATGATLDEARRELAEAMLRYARAWADQATAMSGRIVSNGHARRILLAGDAERVLALIDRDAAREVVPTRATRAWTEADPDKPRRWMGPRDRIEKMRAALAEREDDDVQGDEPAESGHAD
jgi:hypothetical protein